MKSNAGSRRSKRIESRNDAKRSQGFEHSPPLCRNCDHFLNGGQRLHPKVGLAAHRCSLGQFNTSPWSVCDRWTSKGEVLDAGD